MEQRGEPLTALLAAAWRGLGRGLAATADCSTALARRSPERDRHADPGRPTTRRSSPRSAGCEGADGRWRMLPLAYRSTRRMEFLADAASLCELQLVQNGQGLTPEIARRLRAASRFAVIAKVIKNRRLCTSAPDVTRQLEGPIVVLGSIGKVAR